MIQKLIKMDLKSRIYDLLPLESGVGGSGKEWKKQIIIFRIKEDETYPKFLAIEFWNDKVAPDYRKGEELAVTFEVYSKEWNGKYYTVATASKVERLDDAGPVQQAQVQHPQPTYQQVQQPVSSPVQQSKVEKEDDLPF